MASIATINIDATGFHGFPVVSFDGESRIGNLCKVWHFLGTGANEIHLQSIHGFHQGGWMIMMLNQVCNFMTSTPEP